MQCIAFRSIVGTDKGSLFVHRSMKIGHHPLNWTEIDLRFRVLLTGGAILCSRWLIVSVRRNVFWRSNGAATRQGCSDLAVCWLPPKCIVYVHSTNQTSIVWPIDSFTTVGHRSSGAIISNDGAECTTNRGAIHFTSDLIVGLKTFSAYSLFGELL